MSLPPTLPVAPAAAADAYARVDRGAAADSVPAGGGFGAALSRALDAAVRTGHEADAQAMQALSGGGNLTEVVTALSRAELTLQTATAVRDRVVQAYQDIIKMPI
ncbi:MAG: hypothetical protein BGO51_07055 [Rhodospirillales bacterium 69-11]|nr:flagellar hook-basal body complex protein FliE [Rhodospirillales bacterium]OJW24081.1 MAG: hypothetical protein BGO51_07055 [Rhodospirillales bacterium 69-11]